MDLNGHGSGAITAGRSRGRVGSLASVTALGPWLAQAGLPFLLVAYLGLRGGGYDEIVRGEVGIAAWWIVIVGAAAGILPIGRITRAGFITLGIFGAFAAWTALGIGWSESAERSVAELGRVAALLAVFALALTMQGADGLRRTVGAVAAGFGLVAGVALLSRLQPSWFPAPDIVPGIEATRTRLNYPLDYWNGLAALVAIGTPLLLAAGASARTLLARALFCAAVPAVVMAGFFTVSRGGGLALAVALVVLFAFHPRRLSLAVPALVTGLGSAILIAAATQRTELSDGLGGAAAASQGDEMLAMVIVVCLGVGLLTVALGLAERHGLGPRVRVSRQRAFAASAVTLAVGVVVAIAAGVPQSASQTWSDFKDPVSPASGAERFDSASGSGRYQFWETAVDAARTEPLVGIGPGTYEYFWAREGSLPTFIRDAHSLYLETAAELGVVGLVIILALVGAPFVAGIRRSLTASTEDRVWLAAALAGCAAFAVAAGVDWAWELTVLPVAFLLLTAAILGRGGERRTSVRPRLALVGLSIAGMIAIAIPMASASAVRDSQSDVRAQDLGGALDEAQAATTIQPYASSASLQEALVLELQGDLEGATAAAIAATEDEPTNWRTWLVLSRLQANLGNAEASVEAYREAKSLNPRSALFQ